MSVPHRKLSSASTASTSSLRQIPDFEPDENWKANMRGTIDASVSLMINEAKEELEKQVKLDPGRREQLIAEFKRTEAEIKSLADEEYQNEIGKERAQRRWAAGAALPAQLTEALRSEQQTILNTIQAKNPQGENNRTPGESSSPAGRSTAPPPPRPPPVISNETSHESSESEGEDNDESEDEPEPPASARVSAQRIPPARKPSLEPLRPIPDRNVAPSPSRVHQIWKPSISPEDDTLSRRLARRSSTTSIRSNGSLSYRTPITPNPIPEFSEPEDHTVNSEREKAQTRQAEQQWTTLNRAREKEKEPAAQKPALVEGRIASAVDTSRIDNVTRTPSPISSGATSPPPALPLSTKPSRRPVAPNGPSLLSSSRPPAENPYPSPSPTPNRHSGSNYEMPPPPPPPSARYAPPPLHLSTSTDSGSNGSYEESPSPEHTRFYHPSSSYEDRNYARPMYARRESDPYTPYPPDYVRGPDYYSPIDHPYPRQDPRYDGYFRPPSSGPLDGGFGPYQRPYYEYPVPPHSARTSPYPYNGPYAPPYYDPGRRYSDLSRRNSTTEYRHSAGSLEQDPAWRSWGLEQPRQQQYESPEPVDVELPEEDEPPEVDEEEERREAEHQKEEEEAEQARRQEEVRKREEEEEALRRKEEEIRQKEEETKKKEQDIKKKEELAKKKEAEIKKKEADAKKKEAEAKKKEEQARQKEQEIRKKEEEAKRKAIEAARQAEENRRREEAMREKEEALLRLEAELKRKEREIEVRALEEEEKRKQEEEKRKQEELARERAAEKRRQEEKRRREEEVRQQEEEKRRRDELLREQAEEKRRQEEEWRRHEEERRKLEVERRQMEDERRRREEERRLQDEEQSRREEFKRQENDAAWHIYEAQKQRKEAAEAEKRSQNMNRPRDERSRQDSMGSENVWPGSPSASSTYSSASSASSRTTASSSASKSSGASAWTTWSSQTSASNRSSTYSTSTPKPPQSAASATASTPKSATPTATSTPNTRAANEPTISMDDWQRRQEEFARKQQEKFRQEQEKLERERLAKSGTMLTKDDVLRLFESHNRMWTALKSQTSSELRWDSFPWPTVKKPSSPEDITFAAVDAYIFSPYYPEKDKSDKDRVKEHIKKWHPDRFDNKWLPNVVKRDQSLVKEGAGQVVRYLNDLLAKTNSPSII